MSNSKLQVLADNRKDILLAETGAWLHDMGKCSDEHVVHQASDPLSGQSFKYKTAFSNLLGSPPLINLLGESVSLRDLVEKGMPKIIDDPTKPWLLWILGRCHAAAHIEKEKEERDNSGKQPKDDTRLSSAFGYESSPIHGLTQRLQALPFGSLTNRGPFIKAVHATFSEALGDTRRPVNEVTLWDWSSIVAAMYKAAIAGALLGYKPEPDDIHWRLLTVRVDSRALFGRVVRIADLKARQEILENAFEHVRVLIEETYPLGICVYQDANSVIYVVPNIVGLLELTDSQEITLRELILAEFSKGTIKEDMQLAFSGEVVPLVELDTREWCGQKQSVSDEVPPIAAILSASFFTSSDAQSVTSWWSASHAELCPICRLRPMRENAEACGPCRKRRSSRIEEWLSDPRQTIWMDEIADQNDRVALIVGKFGLDDWLSGELLRTILVKAEANNPNNCEPKNPSPARLRRIWETTQRFWEETIAGILREHLYAQKGKMADLRGARLLLKPDNEVKWQENVPYDGTINGRAISLLWLKNQQRFITISNLQLAAGEARSLDDLVQGWGGCKVTVSKPDQPSQTRTFGIQKVEIPTGEMAGYHSHLVLLTSPDQFLALVPASDALLLAEKIRGAYQAEFGKVQNRLPLFLGLIFFQRKMPLMAVMDTARRMLEEVQFVEERWKVDQADNGQVKFFNKVCWNVPAKMGDDRTEDIWYPYFFLEGDPGPRKYCFQDNFRWLVHVKDLKMGDIVRVTPSRFGYLYLEHAAQRFEFNAECDLMLLDELPHLMEMWRQIRATPEMTDTRLRGIQALFDFKWQAWQLDKMGSNDWRGIFEHLVGTTFKRENIFIAIEEVLNERFKQCLDLYLRVLKQRVKEEQR